MSIKKTAYGTFNVGGLEHVVLPVDTAKRHVIRINGIDAYSESYKRSSYLKTGELVEQSVESIAIYANEYIPGHFPPGKYITYTLTVNGKDYDVEPINSNRAGKKIIKRETTRKDSSYEVRLGEIIKSAILTIKIESSGEFETPRLSGIKVLYGKGETDI